MATRELVVQEDQAIEPADWMDFSAQAPAVALRRPMSELIEATIQAASRSQHTERAYRMAIGLFLQYLDSRRGDMPGHPEWRPFAEQSHELVGHTHRSIWAYRGPAALLRMVDNEILDSFRRWREQEGDSPNAASLRINAVRTFLGVALREGVLTEDQARAMRIKPHKPRQIRDEQPAGRRLDRAEVRRLREAPNPLTNKGKRDLAILDLILYAGLRREEVAELDAGAFYRSNGRWWLKLRGKGQKTRKVKVHDVLYGTLTAWLSAAGLELDAPGRAFRSVNKGDSIGDSPINASVVGRIVAEYGELAGLAKRGQNQLSAHDLRRTCARNAYDNGASLLLVKSMLGHSDPKTTERYIGAYESDDNTAVDHVRY